MRRMPADARTELAVEASVQATTAAAGRPVLVMGSRTVSITYIALAERVSARDHQAEFFALILRALQDAGLHVEVWEFSGDPRFLRGPGGRSGVLDELMRGHPDRRLLIFADGRCLIDPVTGMPAAWTTALVSTATRVLLTPRPEAEWGSLEQMLADQLGFRVEEATPEGIQRFAASIPVERSPAGGTTPVLAMHAFLASRPLLWTSAVRPTASTVRLLITTLSRGLDARCLGWLRALAVYPELRLPLTLHIGAQLAPAGTPEEMTRRILTLARLPWLRNGTMPDWLRRELLAGMSSAEEAAVRSFFRNEGDREGSRIDLDVLRPSADALLRPPHDGVFLDFVYGLRRIRGIPVRLLQRLAALLRLRRMRRFLAAVAGGSVLAFGLSVLLLSLVPLDPCDSLGADIYDPDRIGAGIETEALALRPGVVAACSAAVARDSNNGRWQYQLGSALRSARPDPAAAPISGVNRNEEIYQPSGIRRMTAQNSVTEEQRKPWAESIAKSASLGYPIAEQALAYEDFQNGDWVSGRKHLDRLRGLNVALALEVEGAVANFGWEGPSDQGEALRKYQASIEAGDNYVIEAASILSAQGDWRGYFAMLRHGVAVGDPAATRFLGYWTQFGKREAKEVLITPNITEAKRLDAAAAAGGDSVGLHNYAIQLWYRSADSLDHRRACNLMLQSAYLGSVLAMFDLAKMLATSGSECGLNGMTPRILYEHAADAGNVDALLALGDAYKEGGLGLRVNAAEAAQCYRRVVESDEATDDQKSEARKKITELEKQP
jgi:TPR repeat protein